MFRSIPLLGLPLGLSKIYGGPVRAQCESKSDQEAAEELQRIIESNNGEMPTDPEEMMALLAKARPKHKRNPMTFERMSQGTRHMVRAMRQNDGFMFDMALPFGRHFSTALLWKFSNKNTSVFESTLQLVGGNPSPMADQDTTPFMAMMQNSQG